MPNTLENLKSLDLAGLPSFYPEPPEAARNVEIGLPSDRILMRTPEGRRMIDARHVANLARSLEGFPKPGETWHVVCKGNWPAWALVPRMLELSDPPRLDYLGLATLGYSRDNADALLKMLDEGTVGRCDLLYSAYFKSNEKQLTSYLSDEMNRRGQRCAAVRTHAKLILMRTGAGESIVVESSANLRSCRNLEQFTITHDAALLDFHAAWLSEVLQGALK